MDGILKLIQKTMTQNELGYPIATETEVEVYCVVQSIGRAEYFNASKAGIVPEYTFVVNAVEYSGEDEVEYEGKRYSIYRTYRNNDFIELYAEYRSGND
jgi:hypothetical protein